MNAKQLVMPLGLMALGFALIQGGGTVNAQPVPSASPSPTVLGQQAAPMTPEQSALLSQLGLASLPQGATFGVNAQGEPVLILGGQIIQPQMSVPSTAGATGTGAETSTPAGTTGTDTSAVTGTQAGTGTGPAATQATVGGNGSARTSAVGPTGVSQLPSTSTR